MREDINALKMSRAELQEIIERLASSRIGDYDYDASMIALNQDYDKLVYFNDLIDMITNLKKWDVNFNELEIVKKIRRKLTITGKTKRISGLDEISILTLANKSYLDRDKKRDNEKEGELNKKIRIILED